MKRDIFILFSIVAVGILVFWLSLNWKIEVEIFAGSLDLYIPVKIVHF